jgi:hypothetical protein
MRPDGGGGLRDAQFADERAVIFLNVLGCVWLAGVYVADIVTALEPLIKPTYAYWDDISEFKTALAILS